MNKRDRKNMHMRTFIIVIVACIYPGISHADVFDRLPDIIDELRIVTYTSYGYGDDDDNNYNNYNNDDDNSNYNNDDDNSNYNNDDDNYNNGDDDDHYSNDDDDSSEIPLDGGLGFLAAAGAGLGIKKLRDNRARKKAGRSEK
jgi:hypothetical protein